MVNTIAYDDAPSARLNNALNNKPDILYAESFSSDDIDKIIEHIAGILPKDLDFDDLDQVQTMVEYVLEKDRELLRSATLMNIKDIIVAIRKSQLEAEAAAEEDTDDPDIGTP